MVAKDWKSVTLKELLDGPIKNGYSPNATDSETGYWVLGLGALGDEGINSSEIKPVLPEERVLQNILRTDDFLVSRSNTPDKVGRSIRFRNEIENCSYPDLMMRFRIDENKADKAFIEHQLKSAAVRTYFKNCAAGSSSTMVKINKGILEKTPLVVPPVKEQKKIAQILSTWDKAISVTEKLLTNSQQQKKALMQQLLSGKKRLLDENGVMFSGEWEVVRLKQLIHEEKKRNRDNHIQRVLSVTNHSGFVLPEEQFSKRVASEDVSTYKIVKKNQYGYNPSRLNVGSFARLDNYDEGVLSPMYVVFSINHERLNSDYFLNWMSSNEAKQRIAGSTQGSVRDSVGFDALCSFSFSLPTLMEQQKIAAVLSAADAEMSMLEKKLACLKEEKKALMQQLLTGKRRVKTEVEETVSA
ncbi:restriction endonuclease subunit S [Salmonella enterica subsp. arizonae]|nr:restriction endonuclease subunit S [Salmonella enterica subsp. arizonae]